jgi:hypothetical protein
MPSSRRLQLLPVLALSLAASALPSSLPHAASRAVARAPTNSKPVIVQASSEPCLRGIETLTMSRRSSNGPGTRSQPNALRSWVRRGTVSFPLPRASCCAKRHVQVWLRSSKSSARDCSGLAVVDRLSGASYHLLSTLWLTAAVDSPLATLLLASAATVRSSPR